MTANIGERERQLEAFVNSRRQAQVINGLTSPELFDEAYVKMTRKRIRQRALW